MDEPLHVIGLRASNVKRLQAIEVFPPPGLVIVGGRNGSGKSSLLDSIWYAIGGRNAQRSTPQPIREGEAVAEVVVDLGALVVTRTWHGDDSTLVVRGADGSRLQSPQALLDALTGAGAFDPLAFVGLSAREQRETLLGLVDLPFDLAEIAEERAAAFEQRTDRNRELKALDARIAAIPRVDIPADIPSISDALAAHRAAQAVKTSNEAVRSAFHRATIDHDASLQRLAEARSALAVAEEMERQAALHLQQRADWFDRLELDPDLTVLAAVVDDAERFTAARHSMDTLDALQDARRELAAEVVQCEEFMAEIDERKARGLAEAKMPYEGLGFADDDGTLGITYQGKPFTQASAAEKLRVAAAIAMAGNPRIRVMCIHDGSLLDDDNLAMLADMAAEHSFQVWLEVVGDDGDPTIVIEDGQLR